MNATEPVVCGFDGNPDLYGLGVRSGIYIQVVSFFLAAFRLKKESAYLQSSAFVFLFAIFIALVRETANRTLRAPEAAILNWLVIFQLMGVVTLMTNAVSAGTVLRLAMVGFIFPAYIGYNGWFWWVGIDVLPAPPPGCDEYGYMFTKVNLRGWFHTLNKVVWTFALVMIGFIGFVVGILAIVGVVMGGSKIKEWWQKRDEPVNGEEPTPLQLVDMALTHLDGQQMHMQSSSGDARAKYRITFIVLDFVRALLGAGILLAFTVPPFELVIKWNQIRGVDRLDSVGQLVPFMLSLGQLIHIIYSILRGKDDVRRKNTIVEDGPCPEKQRVGDVEEHQMSDTSATQVQVIAGDPKSSSVP